MKNLMKNKLIKQILDKVFTREAITYIIAGVLTTIVNFVTYQLFYKLLSAQDSTVDIISWVKITPNLLANTIAWIIAVLFAYVVNNFWVFKDHRHGAKNETVKLVKFINARLVSFGFEELGMFLFVDVLHFHNLVIKGILAVFVIIMNYVLSKFFVFQTKNVNNKEEKVF